MSLHCLLHRAALMIAACALAGCPKGKSDPTTGPGDPEPAADACAGRPSFDADACRAQARMAAVDLQAPIRNESELAARVTAACDAFAARMTACSIADAKASLTDKEYRELDVEQLAPQHSEQAKDACVRQDLAPRQVRVYEGCLGRVDACADLLDCLDQAKPTP